MIPAIQDFDPVKFLDLDINGDQEEISKLRDSLNKSISEYVLLYLIKELDSKKKEGLENVKDAQTVIKILRNSIPDMELKINIILDNFKKEFDKRSKK